MSEESRGNGNLSEKHGEEPGGDSPSASAETPPESSKERSENSQPPPNNSKSEERTNQETETPEPSGELKKNRKRFFIIGGIALLIIAVVGLVYWLYARQYESTDDAFIDGDIVQVSPKVSAYVTKVNVAGNQFVHKGDLLVELDEKDLRGKLEQAQAQLQTAQSQYGQAVANTDLTRKSTSTAVSQATSNLSSARGNVAQTRLAAKSKQAQVNQADSAVRTAEATLAQFRAQIEQAESNLRLAQVEYDRRLRLYNNGDVSKQLLDQGLNALQAAQSQLNSLRKEVDAAQFRVDEARANARTADENYRQSIAQVGVTESQVGESQGRLADANAAPERIDVSKSQIDTAQAGTEVAEAAVREAELELSYAKIYAPEDGYVTQKTVEVGQLVSVGTPLMAISLSNDVWVVANFKETQLEDMKIGQTVYITVDAYPGKKFTGKIDSLQAGTGSRFSLLPAENASGNYVKVVQRVPVKIVFDQKPDVLLLAPGMSVEPSVKVR